jgi:tetratricopeptide (TPR) repeat protein
LRPPKTRLLAHDGRRRWLLRSRGRGRAAESMRHKAMIAFRDTHARLLLLTTLFTLLLKVSPAMSQPTPSDFSERLDKLWEYSKPAESEQRFRTELDQHPGDSREALETLTQIARTQGLRRMFDEADATLDTVAPRLNQSPVRVRIRYLLERGRTRNSGGDKSAAIPLFNEAVALWTRDTLSGADFYRIDAMHMLGIATKPAEQLVWNLKALTAAEASSDPRARAWAASLTHNIGWSYFDAGDPVTALVYWRQALPIREAAGDPESIRVAKWTIARGYRATGKLDDAEKIQRALVLETEQAGEPDGYVYEELAEIAMARGDRTAATPWAAKAYALLKDDGYLKSSEAARLQRLADLGASAGKTP